MRGSIADTVDGCVLVPVNRRQDAYPLVAKNVLEGTHYRVVKKTGEVRSMVTVMPDGLHVAWDSCARCFRHIRQCGCAAGVYHPKSIAWIRATFDLNYPTEKVTADSYAQYYDPYARNTDNPLSAGEAMPIGISPVDSVPAPKRKAKQEVDFEDLDLAKIDEVARRSANKNIRSTRTKLGGTRAIR